MIYVIEDDPNIRELVVYSLENTGKKACGFEQSAACIQALERCAEDEKPRLLLLDIMLPGEDGISFLKKIRAGRLRERGLAPSLPVILLTAKSAEYDKVRGLDAGADDYLVKPFGIMELIARIRAVLRRVEHEEAEQEISRVVGNVTINIPAHGVFVNGQELELTIKEFKLFNYLLEHRGAVLSREKLLDKVWGYEFITETRTVDVHIRTLRQKLEAGGADGDYIETVRGAGYRLRG
jgi:two-component system alkaline phosphatase synthesis response regulator PhoP